MILNRIKTGTRFFIALLMRPYCLSHGGGERQGARWRPY